MSNVTLSVSLWFPIITTNRRLICCHPTRLSPTHTLPGKACFLLLQEWLVSLLPGWDLLIPHVKIHFLSPLRSSTKTLPWQTFNLGTWFSSTCHILLISISTFNILNCNYYRFIFLTHCTWNLWGLESSFTEYSQEMLIDWQY